MRIPWTMVLFLSGFALAGCSVMPVATTKTDSPQSGAAMQGRVHGGQQPIVGAHVYLYAANNTGYGKASVSLLTSATGNPADGSGNYYVTTDANGDFGITGDYTCPSSASQVYLYSIDGNSGSGSNASAGLLAAVGACAASGTLSSSLFVMVNEVSTVATAYAITGFATDAVHVSSSGTSLAEAGIANAFANAGNLETLSTGVALAKTPAGNGTVPRSTINTLANILASCVNSTGPASTPCATLLADALSGGTTGTAPTDTATAAINIAHNPASNIAALYALSTASPPFAPALTAKPNDLTIGLGYTGGGQGYPEYVSIDASGNAWFGNGINYDTVTEYSSLGAVVSGSSGYYGAHMDMPFQVAIDPAGNAWIANTGSDYITEISGSPVTYTAYGGGDGVTYPTKIAIDGASHVWEIDEVSPYSIVEMTTGGSFLSGTSGYAGAAVSASGMAIDGSGNVWFSTPSGGIEKLDSSGTLLSGSGYTGGGLLSVPNNLAIDGSGDVWATSAGIDSTGGAVAKFSNAGEAITSSSGITGGCIADPSGIAVDGAGNVWVGNISGNCITEISSSGSILSGTTGYSGGLLNYPEGIAIDSSGDLWIVNGNDSNIVEMIGVAAPVITPIAAGLPSTPTANGTSNLGTRP
jgi:hypothetical protein